MSEPASDDADGSVYKVIQLVGTSPLSWEDAARNAVRTAGTSLRDLRIATVSEMDHSVSRMQVGTGRLVDVGMFRVKLDLSFKYGG